MFLHFQIPLSDARIFVEGVTGRLKSPAWPHPQPNKEFLRGFGGVKKRRKGGSLGLLGEGLFCQAQNAVRFGESLRNRAVKLDTTTFRPKCLFRRFHFNGKTVGRFEIGVVYLPDRAGLPVSGDDLLQIVKSFFQLPIFIFESPSNLLACGDQLAARFLHASTQLGIDAPISTPAWWVSAGSPMLLVEHSWWEVEPIREFFRQVSPAPRLSYRSSELAGCQVPVWLLETDPQNREAVRDYRLAILRLHSEFEGLRHILRHCITGKVRVQRETERSNLLQRHLLDATHLLRRKKAYGIDQTAIIETIFKARDLIDPSDRASLLDSLQDMRINVRNAVRSLGQTMPAPSVDESTAAAQRQTIVVMPGGTVVNNNVDFGRNNNFQVGGNLTITQSVDESLSAISKSSIDGPLKEKLEELCQTIRDASKEISPAAAENLSVKLKDFTLATTSAAPKKEWYSVSGEGLIEAAKAVASLGGKVLPLVTEIVGILAKQTS